MDNPTPTGSAQSPVGVRVLSPAPPVTPPVTGGMPAFGLIGIGDFATLAGTTALANTRRREGEAS